MKSYSQNKEDLVIWELVKHLKVGEGIALDIGAHDGVTFSNTRMLYQVGWTILWVEPRPAALLSNILENEASLVLDVALLPTEQWIARGRPSTMAFWESETGLVSTLSGEHRERWSKREKFVETQVKCGPVAYIGKQIADQCIQVVSVDTEGSSHAVFVELREWLCNEFVKPLCWVVEVDTMQQRAEAHAWATQNGYRVVTENAENVVLGLQTEAS